VKRIRSKKLWAGTLAATAAAGLGLTLVTTAPADTERRGSPKTIRMVLTQGPLFNGPDTIVSGQSLRILNRTKVQDIGPHFFSIFTEDSLPTTNQEIRACARIEFAPCENVAKAHNVSRTFNVRRRNVDRGANGWDSAFTSESQGDSWFTDEKRESETRTISAEPGSTLYYICVIHPQTMTGSIQVTD
jgi:hypothetical protein